jgi:hypothetical protein
MRVHRHTRRNCALPLWLAILLAPGMTACSSTPAPITGAAEKDQAQVFSARCSGCHALPHPKRHTYPEWQRLVTVMEQRMQERGVAPLDDQQRRDILTYLKLNGR